MNKVTGTLLGTGLSILLIVGAMFLFILGISACNNFNRSQSLKDTHNNVLRAQQRAKNSIILTGIEKQRYQQQIQIEKLKAKVRFIHSVGIREAQDEIRKTLTPLYVQFEMTQALQQIATSGKNNTIIYLPTSPTSGLPVVPTSNTFAQAPSK